jgi:nucleoside-diphosphate-sugar epimerase
VLRILFIGGTGLISSACAPAVVQAGHELWLLNRGRSPLPPPDGAQVLLADARDEHAVAAAVSGRDWDVVVQWLAYTPDHVGQDIRVFAGHARQYVFISSASVYQKPPNHWLITEDTPLGNPFWQYARDKIACEELLEDQTDLPWTVVRPSLTYGPSQVPTAVGSWLKPFTIIDRMRRGAPVIVPGDGTSIWTITHNSDFARGFVGLLGRPEALYNAFHITSDEALTWNQIYQAVADAAGAKANFVHVPTDGLVAADDDALGSLWGDKAHSAVFDNLRARLIVPSFRARVPFAEGIKQSVAWFDADPARQVIDDDANRVWDRVAQVYTDALAAASGLGQAQRPRL